MIAHPHDTSVPARGEAHRSGLLLMVGAAFFFSLMSLFVKLAGKTLPTMEIVFARAAITLLITLAMMGRKLTLGNAKGLLLLRGVAGVAGLTCFFFANVHLPLADAATIFYTNPVFTAFFAALFLGERLLRLEVAALFASLVGVVVVARPAFIFGHDGAFPYGWLPVAAALLGAVSAAIAYTVVRKLRETDSTLTTVLYFPLVATPVTAIAMLAPLWSPKLAFIGTPVWPSPLEWGWLLGVAVCVQVAQVLLTRGLQLEQAGRALSMSYVQILFAAIWEALVFSRLPGITTVMGAALIGVAMLLVARARRGGAG